MEQLVEWKLAGETEVLWENPPQRHFVHHKSYMTRPGLETRAAAVGSQRLTAWAMARPSVFTILEHRAIQSNKFIRLGIVGVFGIHPSSGILRTITFRKLDVSVLRWKDGRHLLCRDSSKERTGQLIQSQSQNQLLDDWRFTANQLVLKSSPLRLTTSIFSTEHLRT
jgi:hypothetical protein